MKKPVKILINRLLSIQLKKALFEAFFIAKKNKTNIIDSQILIFGILKSNNGVAYKTLNKIYKSKYTFNPVDKLLSDIEKNFINKYKFSSFKAENKYPTFSRPVRRLLFFLIRSTKNQKYSIITTLDVLNYLLRHKYVKNFVKQSLLNTL